MTICSGIRSAGQALPVLLLAFSLFGAPRPILAADKPKSSDAFEAGKVWPVHITLSAEEYAAMQPRGGFGFLGFGAPPKAPAKAAEPKREVHRNTFGVDLPWATGSVTVGDQTFDKVGIRYKGNGTIGDASRTIKKSIKIDLDRAGGTGRWAGSKTINLHSGVADPSKCRETLSYEVYRAAGVPAPRTAFAEVRLSVPGKHDNELLGIYTIVEEVDKPFLLDRFGADKGLLMKPEGLRDFTYKGDDWDKYKRQLAPKRDATADETKRLIAFAKLVEKADDATFKKEIASFLDVDNYLRFLAATSFVANTDCFFVLGHNYYLYLHPKTNKLHFVPWDVDRAMANLPILGSNSKMMDLSLTHPYGGTHRLTQRLLAIPEVAEQNQKLLKNLSETAFAKEPLLKKLSAMQAVVKGPLERDTKAVVARKEPTGGFGAPGVFGVPPPLKLFIEKRSASVAAQVTGTSKGYVPTSGFGAGGPPKIGDFMAPHMLAAMDKDGDGMLARDEWLGAAKRLFDSCEKDKDGHVNVKSLKAALNAQIPKDGARPSPVQLGDFMAGPIFERSDANKDGKLTSEELLAATGAAFDEFDKKKAGKLDEDALADLFTAAIPLPKLGPPPGGPKKDEK